MRRIVVLGSGGAGKSTLARQLGVALGLPVFHLDALFWRPGWTSTPREERVRTLDQLVRSEGRGSSRAIGVAPGWRRASPP